MQRQKQRRVDVIDKQIEVEKESFSKARHQLTRERIEDSWMKLEEEKRLLQEELDNEFLSEKEFEKLYKQFVEIIEYPLAIRDLGSVEMKQLLIGVLFGGKIYYTKNEEFQTPHSSLIYSILDHISGDNYRMGRQRVESSNTIESFSLLKTELCEKSELIYCLVAMMRSDTKISQKYEMVDCV